MHGIGHFGIHGGARMGREDLLTPAYVLITASSISDADAFKVTIRDLLETAASFGGRLVVDVDKPVAWEGSASEHIVMIGFGNPDQAQAWKNSDAFKHLDAELHRDSTSTIQLVEGLPTPAGRGGRGGARFDPKAFEPNVKDYDQLLNKMHGICKGC